VEGNLELQGVRVVTGVIGEDIHVVGLRILEHALKSAGAHVISLGVQTPIDEFVEAAQESAADAIFISSSNGHAGFACEGFKDDMVEAGLGRVLLYIGGQLVVGRPDWSSVHEQFEKLGFDRVYPPRTNPKRAIADLAQDLRLRDRPQVAL